MKENVDGAIGSLHLAMLREQLKAFEFIRLLAKEDRALADAIVRIIRHHVRDFSRDPNDVMDHVSTAVIRELLDRR